MDDMRLGIMLPYYFPYLGHVSFINQCHNWIVFDIVKFGKKTWMTRNRVLTQGGEISYVNVLCDKAPTKIEFRCTH